MQKVIGPLSGFVLQRATAIPSELSNEATSPCLRLPAGQVGRRTVVSRDVKGIPRLVQAKKDDLNGATMMWAHRLLSGDKVQPTRRLC